MSKVISCRDAAKVLNIAPNQMAFLHHKNWILTEYISRNGEMFFDSTEVEGLGEYMKRRPFGDDFFPPPQDDPPSPSLMDRIRTILNRNK